MPENLELIGWRIISEVIEVKPGVSARARAKQWRSDYSTQSLMLEMMAQTGGLVVGSVKDFQTNLVFAKVETAEFSCHAPRATSHDILNIEAFARDGVGEQGTWIDGQITMGGQKIASARLFLIDAGDLLGAGKSVTFHAEFLEYYGVREKIVKNT